MLKQGLDAVADESSELLILGTFPGEESLKVGQYYASESNQFWKVVMAAIGQQDPCRYSERVQRLKAFHIALWDVIRECERSGSLDASIELRTAQANDLRGFVESHGRLKVILFNGKRAFSHFKRLVDACCQDQIKKLVGCALPSTSSANTHQAITEKAKIWEKEIGLFRTLERELADPFDVQ